MDFRNYVECSVQKDGYVFTMYMPAGCSFKAAIEASAEFKSALENMQKQNEEAQKAATAEVAKE